MCAPSNRKENEKKKEDNSSLYKRPSRRHTQTYLVYTHAVDYINTCIILLLHTVYTGESLRKGKKDGDYITKDMGDLSLLASQMHKG